MRFTVPGLAEQRKIAALLKIADDEIEALRRQLAAVKTQKRAVMQRLLTGQVRIKI
jgi:type I restriction enzyme S subunit